MKTINLAAVAAALSLAFGAQVFAADTATITKEEYKATKDRIDADYKTAKERCDAMTGNAKDVCQKEAKGNEKIAKADLDARQKNTDKARREALEAKADAEYDVAKEKCDDLSGNQKDVCVKDAKAVEQRAKADIKAQFASGAVGSSAKVSADDKKDARLDAKEAEYEAAEERCDSLSGDAKTRCIADVKARYNK